MMYLIYWSHLPSSIRFRYTFSCYWALWYATAIKITYRFWWKCCKHPQTASWSYRFVLMWLNRHACNPRCTSIIFDTHSAWCRLWFWWCWRVSADSAHGFTSRSVRSDKLNISTVRSCLRTTPDLSTCPRCLLSTTLAVPTFRVTTTFFSTPALRIKLTSSKVCNASSELWWRVRTTSYNNKNNNLWVLVVRFGN